jgi:hypothetical protein
MTGGERIRAMFDRQPADRGGFWTGIPVGKDAIRLYSEFFQVNIAASAVDNPGFALKAGNDFMHLHAEGDETWKHCRGKPMFQAPLFGAGHVPSLGRLWKTP